MNTDFLVIGSGIAGMTFALKAARLGHVIMVTKKEALDSNTHDAQGGIACVADIADSPQQHIADTMAAGGGFNNRAAVEKIVYGAPYCISELLDMGVEFSVNGYGRLELGLEGGHTRNRIIHAKDFTGREIAEVLYKAIRHEPQITLLEYHTATELLTHRVQKKTTASEAYCTGALVLDIYGRRLLKISADYTALCTGGIGQVYKHTTNPAIATGDGLAMAWRAGAEVRDLEYMQFHPTALYVASSSNSGESGRDAVHKSSFLVSEALRGFGAELELADGSRFMLKYHEMGSLAPRDVVSAAITKELKESGEECVYLNATYLDPEKLVENFPLIHKVCLQKGIDITQARIPVVPSAHYMCGGIVTDLDGRAGIGRLYAFGEVACTGVHGSNRLASNSLLEAMVFSAAAFDDIRKRRKKEDRRWKNEEADSFFIESEPTAAQIGRCETLQREIKEIMWNYAGIERNAAGIRKAIILMENISEEAEKIYKTFMPSLVTLETRNLATAGLLTLKGARNRMEMIKGPLQLEA